MESAGAEMELLHSGFEECLGRGLDRTVVADLLGAHLGLAGAFGPHETLQLQISRPLDAASDGLRGFGHGGSGELLMLKWSWLCTDTLLPTPSPGAKIVDPLLNVRP